MKMNAKVIVAALSAAGIIAPLPALADTITPAATVPPVAQSVVTPTAYTVSYPVTVALVGGGTQNVTFTYSANGTWTSSDPAWTYAGTLNKNDNTAVFVTTTGGTSYGVALSSTGSTQWVPGQTGAVTNPPSVGVADVNRPVTGATLTGWGNATATGVVVGKGITTATLVAAPATAQIIGVGAGGAPVGTVVVGSPITVNPTAATSGPGSAGGAIAVNSNQPNQSMGWGQYTATFPTTPTPAGTTSVAGTVAGTSGYVDSRGIALNKITGTASYNTATGVVSATPVEAAVFSVDAANGNTYVGGTLNVAGQTNTTGLTNTGAFVNTGNASVGGTLSVTGTTNTNGISNTGTLLNSGNVSVGGDVAVAGKTYTNGIVNTGTLTSSGNASIGGALAVAGNSAIAGNETVGGTLGVTGNTTLGGTLAVKGGATVGGTLGVTGNTTLTGTLAVAGATTTTGITNTGNFANSGNATVGGTLGVTGATTLSGATTANGITNTGNLTSTGTTLLTTGGVGANTVSVSSAGTALTGGGAGLALANGRATFAGANATPITVTGVANGSSQYDAVNYGQVQDIQKQLKRGISGAQASLNIPQVDQGKQFNLGVGVGGFDGETAVAIGGSARVSKDGILKASVGFAGGGGSSTVWGVGGGWSW